MSSYLPAPTYAECYEHAVRSVELLEGLLANELSHSAGVLTKARVEALDRILDDLGDYLESGELSIDTQLGLRARVSAVADWLILNDRWQ